MKSFDQWEKKKKEKIEKLQKQKEEEELKTITENPQTNREENSKYNLNPKNYSITERLYVEDIKKRKDKQDILFKIYTPTFTPEIHINRESLMRGRQRFNRNDDRNSYTDDDNANEDEEEEEEDEDEENNSNETDEDEDEEEEEDARFSKKKTYNNVRNVKKDKKPFRKMKTEDTFDSNDAKKKKNAKNKKVKKEEDNSEEDEDNNVNNEKKKTIIDGRLRNLLFRKKKPVVVPRNQSVGKRKKIGFSLD